MNKKGDYAKFGADGGLQLADGPITAKGEYEIAIADFGDALKLGPPGGIILHNRGRQSLPRQA